MGCSESKLHNLPAVSLCRDRCKFLDHALRHLHALAKAHVAYTRSLHSSGTSLRLLFDKHLGGFDGPPTATANENECTKFPAPAAAASPSTSSSSHSFGSHIKFDSDSDSDTDKDPSLMPAVLHQNNSGYEDYYNPESLNVFFDKFTSINYMKRQPAPPAAYIHPPSQDNHYVVDQFFHPDEPPPPPPPAPTESAWDFMNFFDPYELPSSGSRRKDVKESQAYLKEEKKFTTTEASVEGKTYSGGNIDEGERGYEVKEDKEKLKEKAKKKAKARYEDNGRKILGEVEALFQRASKSGDEVLKLINDDVQRVRYCQVNSVQGAKAGQETRPFTQNQDEMRKKKPSLIMGIDGDGDAAPESVGSAGNLSSTLKKLCMWENKLLREVKIEEKLRVMYARKCQELKRLMERGADASKIDSVRAMICSLSTRLNISLRVIDKISLKISKLSEEELCPRITELIHRLLEMWRVMLECHKAQSRAVAGVAKDILDGIKHMELEDGSDDLEVLLQLKLEIHSLGLNFSNWVSTQVGCAGALHGWITRCLGEERPEEMLEDAPLVSVVCSRWARSVARVKEKEVFDATRELYESLNRTAAGSRNLQLQSKQVQDKEGERKMIKMFEKEEQRMLRAILEKERRLGISPTGKHAGGGILHGTPVTRKGEIAKGGPLLESLRCVFESLERFALDSMEVYDELLACTKG
ncbi:hypothetical protein SAY87_021474 [Trapa incisa]|uniref:Uncharacterized protein n=1 Tax=Trapa incisa TaxID=236973 RepID=A0AAN7JRQ9_9MYRT|nr:hypothetical protein SAY87_021474 [Trapa incisa]